MNSIYSSSALSLRRACVLGFPVLHGLPVLPDLIHCLELAPDLSNCLSAIALPERFPFLTRGLPRRRPTLLGIPTAMLLPFLLLSDLPLEILAEPVEGLRCNNLVVFELLAPSRYASSPRTVRFILADLRQMNATLRFPFVKPPTAVAGRKLDSTLGADKLDVVGTFPAALYEPFLLLIPVHLPAFTLLFTFIPCEVECDGFSLLRKCSTVAK